MKVIAINGSPRKGGNTEIMINTVFDALKKQGVETELIQVGGQPIRGCMACYKCVEMQNETCVITKDAVNDIIQKMKNADGIILASPVYFADVTSEMKAIIDRTGFVTKKQGLLKHKVGASLVALRRGGASHAFDTMNHFFQANQMFMVGSTYWNMGFGLHPGEVTQDEEGMTNMTDLGESMAFLIKKLKLN